MHAILAVGAGNPTVAIDGFIGPAHVSTVIGSAPYEPFPRNYGKPVVIAGFEPLDVMRAIQMLIEQINEGRSEVENEFTRAVTREGNRKAQALVDEVFTLRQPLFVPPSMGAVELLGRMRAEQIHLAIVTDEYGGTDGLVTLEDLVEEIFDEIADEHDDAPVDLLIRQEDGSWSADARAPLYDVADEIDPRLAETDVDIDTLGGVAFWLAGQVPAAGARLTHPSGWEIEVTEADERRVRAMRLHPPAPRQEEAERDGTE